MFSSKVSLVEWPWSQTCLDCPHGQFIDIQDKPCSYLCHWDRTEDANCIPHDCPQNITLVNHWKEEDYADCK